MNLMKGMLNEIDRVTELLGLYKEIGSSGVFGVVMLENKLSVAKKAISDGDTVQMVKSYQELKECA